MLSQIAILSFSPISRDARVLRQIECLSPYYSTAVIGYGDGLSSALQARFYSVVPSYGWLSKVWRWSLLLLGRVSTPRVYEYLYWTIRGHRQALAALLQIKPDVIHANDVEALPVAVRAAELLPAKIVLDLHEYAPLEAEDRPEWTALFRPYVEYWLRKYASKACASITVADAIAERYSREYGFSPVTVLNIPTESTGIEFRAVALERIRLVHHGGAIPSRQLEQMIYALALTDQRYELHFMLVGRPAYQTYLQTEAARSAPGRVFFHPPVPPSEIVAHLNEYDMGFYLLRTENYNDSVALPNKFFDFLQAGLAVCIGPSPEMARLVRDYQFGVIADSFEPATVAALMNSLTSDDINRYKNAALAARHSLNSANEMQKLLDLYHGIIQS